MIGDYIRLLNQIISALALDSVLQAAPLTFATEIPISSDLTFVTDVGIITNTEKAEDGHPAFILGGIIYSLNDNIDLDLGLQTGLNKYESDLALLVGITLLY